MQFAHLTIQPFEVYDSMDFSVFTELCSPVNFRTFSSRLKETLYPLAIIPQPHQPLETTN